VEHLSLAAALRVAPTTTGRWRA